MFQITEIFLNEMAGVFLPLRLMKTLRIQKQTFKEKKKNNNLQRREVQFLSTNSLFEDETS